MHLLPLLPHLLLLLTLTDSTLARSRHKKRGSCAQKPLMSSSQNNANLNAQGQQQPGAGLQGLGSVNTKQSASSGGGGSSGLESALGQALGGLMGMGSGGGGSGGGSGGGGGGSSGGGSGGGSGGSSGGSGGGSGGSSGGSSWGRNGGSSGGSSGSGGGSSPGMWSNSSSSAAPSAAPSQPSSAGSSSSGGGSSSSSGSSGGGGSGDSSSGGSSSGTPSSGSTTANSTLSGIGAVMSSSFTQYGAGDTFGSPNCNTATAACGWYSNPGYNAAVSQNLYGVGPGGGAGESCGKCYQLTATSDQAGNPLAGGAAGSIVVKVNNLCPAAGNPLCSQQGLGGTNQYGANVNFDICKDDGAAKEFFGGSTGMALGHAVEVDCGGWSGSGNIT